MMGFGMGFGLLGGLLMLLFWVVLIVGAVWLVRAIFWNGRRRDWAAQPVEKTQTPLEILAQRYARGEITRDQYEIMKQDLGDRPG
jgi:putative membrane protein